MKKILVCLFAAATSAYSFAGTNDYVIDDAAVEAAFNQAEDITLSSASTISFTGASYLAQDEKSVGGFLLRSFFCGFIALHRSYMGTGGETMWWKYFCIPVVGGFTNCIDFWWVVFKGQEALSKYKDNPKFMVWAGE